MHVCIVTCAHRGDDARIVHRQARSLLEAGHRATLVAPVPDDTAADPVGLERVGITRAVGRRRLGAWRAVRRAVRSVEAGSPIDLVIVHDPELVPVLLGRRGPRPPLVWDVHEDFVASVGDRSYIPKPVRPIVIAAVGGIQRLARRRCHVILAEDSYTASFPGAPVVPNTTWIPDAIAPYDEASPRAVYVGRLSRGRGTSEMIEVGRLLAGDVRVVLVGAADRDVVAEVEAAHRSRHIEWLGPLPNPEALAVVRGAAVGLSLLHDAPNYRHSRPTKIVEYLAHGVPVVSTPLPLAVGLVESSGAGEIVPFGDVDAVARATADAVRRLAEPERRAALGRAAHEHALAEHDWAVDGRRFVELLEEWALNERARPTAPH